MATIQQQRAICCEGAKIEWFPVTTGRTIYAGEFVYITSTAGRIQECASDCTVTCGMMAADSIAQAADTLVPVYVPTPDTRYELNVYHVTPTSATTAKALVGKSYNIFAGTSVMYLDRNDQTVPFFKVEKLSEKDAVHDLFGRVIVSIVPEVAQVAKSID